MIERFLKKVVGKAVRVVTDWSSEETQTTIGPHDGWALPYTLNPVFVEVSRTRGCDHPYTWGVVHATNLAKILSIPRISIIEFGVAGGRSLLTLESIATKVESIFGVRIDLYEFDTGAGLSKPLNCADSPTSGKARFRWRWTSSKLVSRDPGSFWGR